MSDIKASSPITVLVSGANGRMGREVVAAVKAEDDLKLVGEVDAGDSLADVLASTKAQVVVDFTTPESAMGNIETILKGGAVPIVGTTGFGPADIDRVAALCREVNRGALIAPNFAVGAVLMMRFAK